MTQGKLSKENVGDELKDDLTAQIESGDYFRQARAWYNIIYISPISQRIFYIVVTCFAALFLMMAVSSVYNLLPISPRVPFVIHNDDMLNQIPEMIRFKAPEEKADPSIMRYYLSTYVQMREGYNSRRFPMFTAFVREHSVGEEYQTYAARMNPANPQSPVRRYGTLRDVKVEVRNVLINQEVAPFTAQVDFTTSVVAKQVLSKTNWTATIRFDYTNLVTRNTYDEEQGDYVLDFDAPSFRVLSYNKRERLR